MPAFTNPLGQLQAEEFTQNPVGYLYAADTNSPHFAAIGLFTAHQRVRAMLNWAKEITRNMADLTDWGQPRGSGNLGEFFFLILLPPGIAEGENNSLK